jgi:hypothetical protein
MCKQTYKKHGNKMEGNQIKFVHCHGLVIALNKPRTSIADTLQKALELYKSKHPKQQSFTFIHYLLFLKDASQCPDMQQDIHKTSLMK